MRKSKRILSLILSLALLATCIALPTGMTATADGNNYTKRVVGYFLGENRLPTAVSTVGLSLDQNIDMIDYASLTHLNVSFLIPADTTSAVPSWQISDMSEAQVQRIIQNCHDNNVKCILSVGGGAAGTYNFFASTARRTSLYNQIITYLDSYGFDGIDMDIESGRGGTDYASLLAELSTALKSRGKLLTMAVAPYIVEGLGSSLNLLDFLNVMTYDQNGSGTSNVAEYQWSIDQLNSYAYSSVAKEKMNMGLPFYGYSTDGRPAWNADYDYAKVVALCRAAGNTNFLTQDSISFPGTANLNQPGTAFKIEFNSRATLLQKAQYVKTSNLGGIMIWDVTKDCIREEDKQYALLETLAALFKHPSSYAGPTNLTYSDLTEEEVTLAWNAPTGYTPSGYKVYYDTNLIGTVTGTGAVISALTKGFTYNFKVSAIDPDGVDTAPATLTVVAPGTPPTPDLPSWNPAVNSYPAGSKVLYNGKAWVSKWGGNETPGSAGGQWVEDTSYVATPKQDPTIEESTPQPPTITTTSLANGRIGKEYSKTLTARGAAPITWSKLSGNLPGGLSLSPAGVISGTPTEIGVFSFTVKATNDLGINDKALSIEIKDVSVDNYDKEPGTSKRTIGYLPWWRNDEINNIDYAKLDYVIVAFLRYTENGWDYGKNKDGSGGWTDAELQSIISKAHAAGSKVLISVGGGDGGFVQSSLPFWYANSREYLANCVFEVVDKFGFDGVDMDAETDDIKFWQGYTEFVDFMRIGIDARDLELSMAVHPWFTDLIDDEAGLYAKYDFLNVMSYDEQFDRNNVKKGIGETDHAPMWHTYQLLDHYTDIGVPADKINVGIPFYYYTYGGGWDGGVGYAYYLLNPSANIAIDTLPGESKLNAWKRTTQQKAYLGGTEYGGAFVWEIGQDNLNNKPESLLTMLYNGVKNSTPPSTPLDPADKVYPELTPVNGTDLPLTPVNRGSVQPDFPAIGGGGYVPPTTTVSTTTRTTTTTVSGQTITTTTTAVGQTTTTTTTSGGSAGLGPIDWSRTYYLGDRILQDGHIYEALFNGRVPWMPPAGVGYNNSDWKYIGPASSGAPAVVDDAADDSTVPSWWPNASSSSKKAPVVNESTDAVVNGRVLISPYWWIGAEVGNTLTVTVPGGDTLTWTVRSINGAAPAKNSIISVNSSGVITALAEGCAVVDATVGTARVASINVQVLGEVVAPAAPVITTDTLASGTVGVAYSQTLTATGDAPITWSYTGTLPEGVGFNTSTGIINGTPTAAGTFNITVTASNLGGSSAPKALEIVIAAPAAQFTVFKIGSAVSYRSVEPNKPYPIAAQAIIIEGRAYAPVRDVADTFGFKVGYDGATDSVTIINGEQTAYIKIGDTHVTIKENGVLKDEYDEAGDQVLKIVDGRTLAPSRFMAVLAQRFGLTSTRVYYVTPTTTQEFPNPYAGAFILYSTASFNETQQLIAVAEAAPYLIEAVA
ncbi:MAG: putative Ig domain-containing protein [Oscillospiraceae bacterium]|jgi:GH18 family chitinase|nr:putative Ig domain-containing protein [Oscillospiraceae bacterium]